MIQRLIPVSAALSPTLAASLIITMSFALAGTAAAQDDGYAPVPAAQPVYSADSGGGTEFAMQAKIIGLNTVGGGAFLLQFAPLATPGVRLMDGKLFLGLGLGLAKVTGASTIFHVSPTVNYDLISGNGSALFLTGWVNVGTIGAFYLGVNGGAGIRGDISDAVSVASEWGLAVSYADIGVNDFLFGFFGSLFVEVRTGG